jgi:protein ImuB
MLWLCISFPRLPLEALALNVPEPVAVTTTAGRSRRIVLGNPTAEQLGFVPGMDYVTAVAIHPALRAVERNLRAERRALERLAAWSYQWSSFVTTHCAASVDTAEVSSIWLEIAASFTLFGGREALLRSIEHGLLELGYSYRLGIAHTLEGAAVLARAERRVVASSAETLRRHLDSLPVAQLALPVTMIFELKRAGLRTVGELIELPRDALARRFGPQVSDYFARLLGEAPDARVAFQLPKKYRARFELGAEVESTESLLFPLRRMLGEFAGYLRAIDSAIQRFTLVLKDRQGVTRIAIGLSAPGRDAERLFALTRERLERVQLERPVIELGLRADRFTEPAVRQNDFFTSVSQDSEEFQQVLDKLAARLGPEAVQGFALVADHRPEKAWTYTEPGTKGPRDEWPAPRPLWLLPEPRRIASPLMVCDGPERIEGGWWSGVDVERDYYYSCTESGTWLWVFRDRLDGEWYVQGICG